MIINEIFKSIDGESRRAGELTTFIRTQGCCLRCSYCDSKYTYDEEENKKCRNMTPQEILEECNKLGPLNITFTGGEPLLQKDADELIELLANNGYDVSIETCGAVDFTERKWFIEDNPNVWVCVDYKCYSSGEQEKMLGLPTFAKLRENDVVKFVVGNEDDLQLAKFVMIALRELGCDCYFYLSPVFEDIEPVEIVNFMMEYDLDYKTRFQLQLHKFVWPPEMRGV